MYENAHGRHYIRGCGQTEHSLALRPIRNGCERIEGGHLRPEQFWGSGASEALSPYMADTVSECSDTVKYSCIRVPSGYSLDTVWIQGAREGGLRFYYHKKLRPSGLLDTRTRRHGACQKATRIAPGGSGQRLWPRLLRLQWRTRAHRRPKFRRGQSAQLRGRPLLCLWRLRVPPQPR